MAASLGFGQISLRVVRHRVGAFDDLTFSLIAYFFGQALLAVALMFLALCGYFNALTVAVAVGTGCAIASFCLWRGSAAFFNIPRRLAFAWSALTTGWRVIAVLALLLAALGFTAIGGTLEGDAIAFNSAVAKLLANRGQLSPLPGYEAFSAVGMLSEVLSAALLVLGIPDLSFRIFSWFNFLPTVLLFAVISGQCGLGPRGKLVACIVPLTSTAVISLFGSGKVDLFAVGPALCACVLALGSWTELRKWPAIALSGVFCAFSVTFKLSYALPLLPTVGLLIVWPTLVGFFSNDRAQLKSVLPRLVFPCAFAGLIFSAGFILAFSPHLIKNLTFYGGLPGIGLESTSWFSRATTLRILLTYPLALTYGSYWGQLGNISPLVICFLPMLLCVPHSGGFAKSRVVAVAVSSLFGLLLWLCFLPSVLMPRYMLAILLLFAIPAAFAAEKFSFRSRRHSALIVWIILATVFYVPFSARANEPRLSPVNTLRYLKSPSETALIAGPLESYAEAHRAINLTARPNDKVLMLTYYRYWLRPDLLQNTSTTEELLSLTRGENEEDVLNGFWDRVRAKGFNILLVDVNLFPVAVKMLDKAPASVRMKKIYSSGVLSAYQIE